MRRAVITCALLSLAVCQQPSPQQFTTAPQCKCSDIEECSGEMKGRSGECKKDEQCTAYLQKIGDVAKIQKCLDAEHAVMTKVEECVRKKVNGELGCTNSATPQNLTIPLIPLIETPQADALPDGAQAAPAGQPTGPAELSHYLMCVDQCSMGDDVEFSGVVGRRKKRSPVNCAFKLKCALAPPSQTIQEAFGQCEKELKVDPAARVKESCECLKAAGIAMQC